MMVTVFPRTLFSGWTLPRASHLLPQRTSRAGIQPLRHHFPLLLHSICSLLHSWKDIDFFWIWKSPRSIQPNQKDGGGGGGCRSTRPHPCLPVWERMPLRPPRPSFFSLLLWLGPLLGALALPLSRKCLGLSTCGPSSHILGVWAAYVGRLSYRAPLIINPEKPKWNCMCELWRWMQRRQGREGSGRSGGPSTGRAHQEEEDRPHPQAPGRWASLGFTPSSGEGSHWGQEVALGIYPYFSHAFFPKSQHYWSIIHIPYNSLLQNVQFSGFSFIHQVVQLLPPPNFWTFSSPPQKKPHSR